MSATPFFTNSLQTVGNVNQTGTLTVQNANNGTDVAATICRSDDTAASTPGGQCLGSEGIVMTPSCGAQFPSGACRPGPPSAPPSGVDPDVFFINSPAVGSGGACVGVNFTVTRVAGSELGKYEFLPTTAGAHVVLPNPGDQCVISFTFSVVRAPSIDIRLAIAGLQTAQVVEATTESNLGNLGSGIGTTTPTTVALASPSITTNASVGIVVGAGTLSDQATVSGLVNTIGTPTVTFRLFGPDNAACTGTAAFTNTQNLTLNGAGTVGTAQSANFTPTAPGVYRWVATYNGDANNNAIAGACGIASETRTVTTPPVNPPPPPPVGPPPPPAPPYVCTPPPGPVPPGGKLCETPPEVCTPPPGPAPAGGELCARGTAAIRGKTGCAGNPFSVVVNGRQIQRVVFALDGKVVRNLSKPNSGTRYVLKVNPRTMRTGVHRIIARTTFRSQSGTKPRVLRVTFSKCSRRASSPAFTG